MEAQKILLGGAIGTSVAGLLVRVTTSATPESRAAWRGQRPALAAGLLFLGLLCWQALNPSHEVVIAGRDWQLRQIAHVAGAPASLSAPFDFLPGDFLPFKNAWRYLLVFGVAWIYAAGLALGLMEYRDAKRWAVIVGLNAAALAVVCLVHRAMGERLTLWRFSDTVAFTGSPVFFYKNHNGAYLAASLAVVLGLAGGAAGIARRRAWQAVALVVWVATLSVNSRVAAGCATLWLVIYGVRVWRAERAAPVQGGVRKHGRGLAAGLAVVAAVVLIGLTGGGKLLGRFSSALESPGDFMQGGHYRVLLRQIGLEMWSDRPVFGWGGGSYLYLFNEYQARVPAVVEHIYREQPTLNRLYMVSVDCDWVEFLAEYGAVGVGLLLFAVVVWVGASWRRGGWKRETAFFLTLGAVGLAAHGWYDHVLRNQAVIVLFFGLLVVGARLAKAQDAEIE